MKVKEGRGWGRILPPHIRIHFLNSKTHFYNSSPLYQLFPHIRMNFHFSETHFYNPPLLQPFFSLIHSGIFFLKGEAK